MSDICLISAQRLRELERDAYELAQLRARARQIDDQTSWSVRRDIRRRIIRDLRRVDDE